MQSEIKTRARKYAVVAVLLAAILGTLCYNFGFIPEIPLTHASVLKTFTSETELRNFLTSNSRNQNQYVPSYGPLDSVRTWIPSIQSGTNGFAVTPAFPALAPATVYSSNSESSNVGTGYSTTNTQVAGVDEPDIVKNDGNYIYTVSGNTVFIVNASQQDTGVVSKIVCDDFAPAGIFVNGDRLAILGSNYSMLKFLPYTASTSWNIAETQTYVKLYDISDRAHPDPLTSFNMTGNYFDSRMIGKYVYFVTTMGIYLLNDTVILPEIYSNNLVAQIPATQIYYSSVFDDYFSLTTFVAMNIQNASEEPTHMSIMTGAASNMYVSLNNIYVTFIGTADGTTIYRVHMQDNNLTCEAQGEVPGQVLNQFSMDEYGNYFRIATSGWIQKIQINNITINGNPIGTPIVSSTQSTSLYVLDMNLSIVGKLESIAAGEKFHSARFIGDTCYLVTFQQTDPLFVVSLKDPLSPTILGNLTMPGYSDYLQPYDENHLIGVGKETVEAESGYFAWYQGVKISIFDVSNVSNPLQMANVTIGDRGTDSPVLYDHKALLFDKEMDLLVIPVTVAKVDPSLYSYGVPASAYGIPVWQGVYVYNITLIDGLVLKGTITHAESAQLPPASLYVNRALYIGDVLYTISEGKIELHSLVDLAFLGEVNLA